MNLALDFVLRATALLAIGLCFRRWIGKGSAERRVTVLRLTLLSLIVLPFAMAFAPGIAVPILKSSSNTRIEEPAAERQLETVRIDTSNKRTEQPLVDQSESAFPSKESNATVEAHSDPSTNIPPLDWAIVGLWIWITVSALLLAITCVRLWQLVHIRRRALPCSTETAEMCQQALTRLHVKSRVECLRSQVRTPVTFGVLRHTVLLPVEFESWSQPDQEAVLLHEAAHIKRFDCAWQWLATALSSVYWCHPLVWSTSRALRDDSELAADERAVRSGIEATDYAASLIAIARTIQSRRGLVRPQGVTFMHQDQLERRVQNILHSRQRGFSSLGLLGLCGTLLGLGAVAGAVHFTRATPHLKDEAIIVPSGYSTPDAEPEIHRSAKALQEPTRAEVAAGSTAPRAANMTAQGAMTASQAKAGTTVADYAIAPSRAPIDRAKLFGSLTAGQKKILRSRGYLYVSELSVRQRNILGVTPGPDYGIQVTYGKQKLSVQSDPVRRYFVWDAGKKRYVPAPTGSVIQPGLMRFIWDPKQKVYVPVQTATDAVAPLPGRYSNSIPMGAPTSAGYQPTAVADVAPGEVSVGGRTDVTSAGSGHAPTGGVTVAQPPGKGQAGSPGGTMAPSSGGGISTSTSAVQPNGRVPEKASIGLPGQSSAVSAGGTTEPGVVSGSKGEIARTVNTQTLPGSRVEGSGMAADVGVAKSNGANSISDTAVTQTKPARSVSISKGVLTYHDGKGGVKRYRVPNGSSVTMLSNGGIKVTGPNGKPVDLAKNIIK